MTWIKICGTTNIEDALMAVEAGADALGFVFYENSPRKVNVDVVRRIVEELPPEIEKVGILPDASFEKCKEVADQCGLTAVQLHAPFGITESDQAIGMGGSTLKKIFLSFTATDLMGDDPRIKVDFAEFSRPSKEVCSRSPFGTVFLEAGSGRLPGGTGKAFDWEKAALLVETMSENVRVVVAGGLNPENVVEAIRILSPWGVDVVSGVESSPGKKDPKKVREFISAVRHAERNK